MPRLKNILTATGYLAVAILIVGATIGLVAYGAGYQYDFAAGKVVRTSLIILQSTPPGAQVSLNGKNLGKKTTYRQSFRLGSYVLDLTRPGFQPWHKLLQVVAGEVTLVQYVILIPNHPTTKTVDAAGQIVAQSISKDHRHLAYITGGANQAVYAYNAGDQKTTKVFALPPAAVGSPAETLAGLQWSDDATRLLVESAAGAKVIDRVMDANGTNVIDTTSQYAMNFAGAHFAPGNANQLYFLAPDGLRRLDVSANVISGVLADKVSQYQVADGRVLYVQSSVLGETLSSIDGSGHVQLLIPALPASPSYAMATVIYGGNEQLAIIPSATGVGTLYSDIYGSHPTSRLIARGVAGASFSPNGHFLVFTAATGITTYDLDRSTLLGEFVTYSFNGISNLKNLSWFDNFHVLLNDNGRLKFAEFDGANLIDLGSLLSDFPAYGTPDFKSVIAMTPGATAAADSLLTQLTIK